jgi:hypothetical protein
VINQACPVFAKTPIFGFLIDCPYGREMFITKEELMKKKIGIALLAMALVGGLVFAVDNCKYYSTNPGGIYLGGLNAKLSGRTISVSSSIKEKVKITSVKVGSSDELIWDVDGNKVLDSMGDTTLTIKGTKKLSGSLVILAESCD